MLKPHTIFAIFFLLILSITNAQAQGDSARSDKPEAPTITASASGERVRFTAPSSVVQTRLEVYDSTGRKVFDNEVRGGNVVDWRLQDGQAAPLADDTYLCAITVKSLSGKITQRIGSVTIQKGSATVRAADASQMTAQQSQAIGPVDENASLSVVSGDETVTTTVVAHNGEEGQITRGRGALSFRLGDFFNGKDTEQMRLTAEGNLGIGITNPQARLDVDGMIRSNQGIVFPDGSIQLSAARRTYGAASKRPGQFGDHPIDAQGEDSPITPSIAGTGTTGKIPKWQDGPNGILTDSVISELGGSIGINGAPDPTYKLDVLGHNRFRGSNVSFYLTGAKAGGNDWLFQTIDADGRLRIFENSIGHAERFSILQNGNVGIGTANPQQNLSVNGALVVDQAGLNNGTFNPGITFGSFSGEGISSKRNPGGNQFGLDLFTNTFSRMSILNNGNVGIGTQAPGFRLDVADRMRVRKGGSGDAGIWFFQTGPNNDRAFVGMQNDSRVGLYGNTGALWGLTMDTTTGTVFHNAGVTIDEGNLGNGGINPGIAFGGTGSGEGISSKRTSGGNQFGLDLFTGFASRLSITNSGNVNIPGNLAAGNLAVSGIASFSNMPGIKFSQGVDANTNIPTAHSVSVDSLTINAPASGYIFVSADVFAFVDFEIFNYLLDFSLSSGGSFVVNSKARVQTNTNHSSGEVPIHLSWVFPVNAGSLQLSTSLYFDCFGFGDHATVRSHNLTAIYLPVQY